MNSGEAFVAASQHLHCGNGGKSFDGDGAELAEGTERPSFERECLSGSASCSRIEQSVDLSPLRFNLCQERCFGFSSCRFPEIAEEPFLKKNNTKADEPIPSLMREEQIRQLSPLRSTPR